MNVLKKLMLLFIVSISAIVLIRPNNVDALAYTSQSYTGSYGSIVYSLDNTTDNVIYFDFDLVYMANNGYTFLTIDFVKDAIWYNTYEFDMTEDYLFILPPFSSNKFILNVYKIAGTMGMGDMESIKANGFSVSVPDGYIDYTLGSYTPTYYYDEGRADGYAEGFIDGEISKVDWATTLLNNKDMLIAELYGDIDVLESAVEYCDGLIADYEAGGPVGSQVVTNFFGSVLGAIGSFVLFLFVEIQIFGINLAMVLSLLIGLGLTIYLLKLFL